MYGDEYAKIGTDNLPPGHSFDIAARARQDAALAAILNLPEHEGPCGASINVREIQEAINKLKYGKALGRRLYINRFAEGMCGQSPHVSQPEEEREAFLARLYSVCPPARQLSDEGRCRWVMGDELPREIENSLYRYLIAISKLRLGILTEQGEGS